MPFEVADDVLGLAQLIPAGVGQVQFLDGAVPWVRPALDPSPVGELGEGAPGRRLLGGLAFRVVVEGRGPVGE